MAESTELMTLDNICNQVYIYKVVKNNWSRAGVIVMLLSK